MLFFTQANPFNKVCLFDFMRTLCDICNQQELILGCCFGKKHALTIGSFRKYLTEIYLNLVPCDHE